MWEFSDPPLSIHPFRSKKLYRRVHPVGLEFTRANFTLHIHSRLDKRPRSYASCELLMEGENNSLKRKAFFRSHLAFHEEGLYEVPYIQSIAFLYCYTTYLVGLGCKSSTQYLYNDIQSKPYLRYYSLQVCSKNTP